MKETIAALMANASRRKGGAGARRRSILAAVAARCSQDEIDGGRSTLYALPRSDAGRGSPAFGYPAKDRRVGIGGRKAPYVIERASEW
jgi:hypothetical protein